MVDHEPSIKSTIAARLDTQVANLSQITGDHMGQIQTMFKAIKKIVMNDPELAMDLAGIGAYLAELAEGDIDSVSLYLEKIGKEVH
jgi:hypothetical protein